MGNSERMKAVVKGRVQGVGFRFFVIRQAEQQGLVGYVRNRVDRTVEVVAEGSRDKLELFLEHLRKGPRAAEVSAVEVTWSPASGGFHDFHVRF